MIKIHDQAKEALDKMFEEIIESKEARRDKIREYLKTELLSLADAVVDYEFYSGPPLNLGTIMKKHQGLTEILDSAPGSEYEDWPEYQQAEFIILNATREYYKSKSHNEDNSK